MKICGIIAEYNPFHLGHALQINYVKEKLGAEKILVIMSGNFTQRGEPAILDKFTRAKHAIKAGADMVIELPTVFATANAETFAGGAINVLSSLNVLDGLCFGVESGDKISFINLAKAMNNESKEFKKALKVHLDNGISLAKAKFNAVKDLGDERFDPELVNSPNNVLGLEYTKALLKLNSKIDIFPLLREGDHNDQTLKKGVTSATSIRKALEDGAIKKTKKSLPSFVYEDLKEFPTAFDKMIMASLIKSSVDDLAQLPDCTEGLENRIKALSKDNHTVEELVLKTTTKRYTMTRIRRILINCLLGIDKKLVYDSLTSPLYAKVLAIKEQSKDLISLISSNSKIPVLTRKSDSALLKKTALSAFNKDVLASDLYALATSKKQNEHQMIIV